MLSWTWNNTTQIVFGENGVAEHLKDFIKPKSRILVTFGFGSIDKNGARDDVTKALAALECETRWEGKIPANPEYDRLMEIVKVAKEFKPDLLLAVGGGSILDGTKFIAAAACLDESITDAYEQIMLKGAFNKALPLASVMTLPATGSEWNNGFVVSRRSTQQKQGMGNNVCYPLFSILDPKYTMTLPPRQLRNGLYDAMCHCLDEVCTGDIKPMQDRFIMSVMKELVDISLDLMKPGSSIELHGRLIQAASFALNQVLVLGKPGCWAIHGIGHMLTAEYGIDHGATLAIVTPVLYEELFEQRKASLAECAQYVFGISEGSVDERARAFIARIREWIAAIGQPAKVSEWEGAVVKEGDVEKVTKMVMQSKYGQPFGYDNQVTEEVVRRVLKRVIL